MSFILLIKKLYKSSSINNNSLRISNKIKCKLEYEGTDYFR